MRLNSVQIKNFKSINDSGPFKLDQVTCLVGKNESGKTAILQALTKLNPVNENEGAFEDLEFPRMTFSEYSDEDRPKEVLSTEWMLDETDITAIEQRLGKSTLKSHIVTLSKGYKNTNEWGIDIDLNKIIKNFVDISELYEEEKKDIAIISTTSDLIKHLKNLSSRSERQAKLLSSLNAAFPEGSATAAAHSVLNKLLPTFLYFGNYEAMKGEVSLVKLSKDIASENLKMPDRIFIALLKMAGTNVDEIQNIDRFEPLVAKLESVSNRLSREIFKYWSQNKHLSIEFRFDAARSSDPPPFNSGYIFRTRIKNTRHGVTVSFDERSTGFVWFFSFLVWFSQVKDNYGENLIILLDEPGLNLHAKAQSDLLRYIYEKLSPFHQVIYTTHSPFMIDPSNLLAVRTVEDVMIDEEILGTKVKDDVLSTDKDTIFPLQAALGYEVSQTLFVGKFVLLVEGPSDFLYFQWASDLLRKKKRTYLNPKWTITPAGSIDKISSFISLFGGNKLHVATVTDYGQGDKAKIQKIRENQLLKQGHIFTLNSYVDQDEADIEDLIGRTSYSLLINECYSLASKNVIPANKPNDAPIRVVKEVEAHFRTLPANISEFDHYTPSAYLLKHSLDFESKFQDLDQILDRFEKLFKDINRVLDQ